MGKRGGEKRGGVVGRNGGDGNASGSYAVDKRSETVHLGVSVDGCGVGIGHVSAHTVKFCIGLSW